MHRSVSFEELIALYTVADACIVSSTRDGMNLVSYEYVACHLERHGVLLLSEFTGAAQCLTGSLTFNPWNMESLVRLIYVALNMGKEQRAIKHQQNAGYVKQHTR